jgi:hypothetical protein
VSERVTVTSEVCIATTALGHERVRCTATHREDERHVNDCYGTWPACRDDRDLRTEVT